jgi:hypothetical protein
MDRTQLLLIALVLGTAWYLYKRFAQKGRSTRSQPENDPESWYGQTQEYIAQMSPEAVTEREESWNALSETEQLDASEIFINTQFGLTVLKSLDTQQKLRLGKAHFLASS